MLITQIIHYIGTKVNIYSAEKAAAGAFLLLPHMTAYLP